MNLAKRVFFCLIYILLPITVFISAYAIFKHYSMPIEVCYCLSVAYFFIFNLLNIIFNGYKVGLYRVSEIVYSNFLSIIITNVFFGFLLFMYFLNIKVLFWPALIIVLQSIFIVPWAWLLNISYYQFHEYNNFILLYGLDPTDLIKKLKSHSVRYTIRERLDIQEIADTAEIIKRCDDYNSIFLYGVSKELKDILTIYCFKNNKKIFYVPDVPEIVREGVSNLYLTDTPILFSEKWGLSFVDDFFKRFLDLLIILPITVAVAPFILLVALCIKAYDRGPAIYRQERLTKDGKVFYIYKFRSMIVDAEKKGAQLSTENDDRITPVGKIIRKIRFDELPQLINILKGDMSIVGPRPERPEIAEEYYKSHPEFEFRLKVKAGLTGYAQVYGRYNTTPIDKVKLDLFYIQNYSLFLDIKLIIYTVKILFLPSSTQGIDDDKSNAL